MMKRRIMWSAGALALAAVVVFAFWQQKHTRLQDVVIPADECFVDAPPVEENEDFIVHLSYRDDFEPEMSQGVEWQRIQWKLTIDPREGGSAKDFSCTLILNDWLLERSVGKSLNYMGLGKGYIGDIPEDSEGFESVRSTMILRSVLSDRKYEAAVVEPVKLMLSYDGQERYYWVTPTR